MFIRSYMDVPVSYHKSQRTLVIKPNTITEADENIFSKAELLGCYGSRIRILSEDKVKAMNEQNGIEVEQTTEVVEENIEPQEGTKELTTEEANTGDEQVDAFLNGETDKLPEGTEEITVEEASKLAESKEESTESQEASDNKESGTKEGKKGAKGKATGRNTKNSKRN